MFEDWLYWTDWETKSVQRCRKSDGSNLTVLHQESRHPMNLVVQHQLQQRPREYSGASGREREVGTEQGEEKGGKARASEYSAAPPPPRSGGRSRLYNTATQLQLIEGMIDSREYRRGAADWRRGWE